MFDLAQYKKETHNFTTKGRRTRHGIQISALEYFLWLLVGRAWSWIYGTRLKDKNDAFNPLMRVPARFEQKHVERCRVFANREEMLKSFRQHTIWAEIGTYEGAFARKIIDLCEPSHLDLMDLTFDLVKARGYVQETDTVSFYVEGDSSTSLLGQPDNKYDYIYIDAGHDLIDVARDVEAATQKLKRDGVLIFNDYISFSYIDMRPYGIVPVVNSLVASGKWEVACFAFHFKMYCDIALRQV